MRLRRRAGTAAVSKAPMRLATCAARGRWAGWAGYGSGRLSASPYCRTVLGQETTAPAQALGVRTWACWACCPQSEVVEKTGGMVSDSLANDSEGESTRIWSGGRSTTLAWLATSTVSAERKGGNVTADKQSTDTLVWHALSRRSPEAAVREVAARTHAPTHAGTAWVATRTRAHGMQVQVWPDRF